MRAIAGRDEFRSPAARSFDVVLRQRQQLIR